MSQRKTTMSQNTAGSGVPNIPQSAQLMQMIFGFMTSQAISVVAKLGIADLLKEEARNADELAQATGTQAQPLYRILRALASVGIFAEDDTGRFQMTPLAEPLRGDAPDSLRDFSIFLGADWHWAAWGDLSGSAQNAQPAFERIHRQAYFDYLGVNAGPAQIFNDAMTSLSTAASAAVVNAYDFTGITRLVDVGGGHGLLLASILQQYPQMHGVLFDAPSVIEGANDVIDAHEVGERCDRVGGDFFASVPAGDACIIKHIIHNWDDERATAILKNCHRSMTENGKLLVVEMVIPEGNAPSLGKLLDLEMLVLFLHAHERTEAEYRTLFEQSGFRLTGILPTKSAYSVIEGVRV